jgi:tetratricopeptide (TPR) repeat protein
MGQEEDALQAYRMALALEPGNVAAHLAMGDLHMARGERDQAINEYSTAAALNRSQPDGYLALGDLYAISSEYELAESAYRQAIASAPANIASRVALGYVLQQQEQYDQAMNEFEIAASYDRSLAWPLLRQGELYQALGNMEAAMSAYEQAIAVEPGNAMGYASLADALILEEDLVAAMEVLSRAIEINPSSAWTWELQGLVYVRRQDLEGALDSFAEALSRDPTLSSAYESVARIYDKWNEPGPTAHHFEALSQQHPGVPWYAWMAADYYNRLDIVPQAMAEYREFLSLVPHYADIHYSLAMLYERSADARAAMHHWNMFLALAAGSEYAPDAEAHRQALRRVVITSPDGGPVNGSVEIRGTALSDSFWYYKIELLEPESQEWQVIGELHQEPVVDGLLGTWDTTDLTAGTYWLRLVVVDETGNFVPPYTFQVQVAN